MNGRLPRRTRSYLVGLALFGCAQEAVERPQDCPPCDCLAEGSSKALGVEVMAFLSMARAAHRIADEKDDAGDLVAAATVLEPLVDASALAPRAVEVEEVKADTAARRADLLSRVGQFDAADHEVLRGLELATEVSFYRGQLLEVRGLVEQRRADALTRAGDAQGAAAAKARAVSAFSDAVRMQESVLNRTLPKRPNTESP